MVQHGATNRHRELKPSRTMLREAPGPVVTVLTVNIKDAWDGFISENIGRETSLLDEKQDMGQYQCYGVEYIHSLGSCYLLEQKKEAIKVFGTFFFIKFQIRCSTLP
jgi:hypothetical protein